MLRLHKAQLYSLSQSKTSTMSTVKPGFGHLFANLGTNIKISLGLGSPLCYMTHYDGVPIRNYHLLPQSVKIIVPKSNWLR